MPSETRQPVLQNLKNVLPVSLKLFLRTHVFSKHCRVELPWFRITDNKYDINVIHKLSFSVANEHKENFFKTVLCSLSWSCFVLFSSIFYSIKNGSTINGMYGVGFLSHLYRMIYLGLFFNITSESFYKFRLFEKDALEDVILYVQHHEIILVLPYINNDIDTRTICDKALFYRFCSERQLPTAPVFVSLEESGRESWFCDENALPETDLIVKPTNLHCGLGVQRWSYSPEAGRWRSNGRSLSQSEFLDAFKEDPALRPALVQPALGNHPAMRGFSTGGLCTLRVVTFRKPGHEPEFVLGVFRMPFGDKVVDNLAAGGVAARLGDDGRLGKAFSKDACVGSFTHHPTTNMPIEGQPLPRWRDMVDLAITAHRHFVGLGTIGWDISLIDSGPILLEGNAIWCAELAQIPGGVPLGEAFTPDMLAEIRRVAKANV